MQEVVYRVEDPATGKVIECFDTASQEEVEAALETAVKAQKKWQETSIEDRAAIVRKVAALFAKHKHELARIAGQEMGKKLLEGVEEAEFSAEIFDYYADYGPDLAASQALEVAEGEAILEKLPIGALLGIMPWNFPYYQVARFAAPNLVLGNAIVLKHAEICPRSAQAIQEIMDEAGVPNGVYTNLFASHEQVAQMIADHRLAGVSLTGSERAGAAVAEIAGKNLKKVVLELGGSDPYIILDTNDVAASAKQVWAGRLFNMGQACDSNKRIIVMSDIYDEFVDALVAIAEKFRPGNFEDERAEVYQPLSSRSAAERLADQLTRAQSAGGQVLVGGKLAEVGAYVSPAVLTGVPQGSDIYYEELFGPVVTVYCVESDEEALELANDTQYGLGSTIMSTDIRRADKIADRIEAGMVKINDAGYSSANLPFGGVKRSGYGRELGPIGMNEFVNHRLRYAGECSS